MRRIATFAACGAILLIALLTTQPSIRVSGQDDDPTRISALETTVAGQGHDISNLRRRVSDLEDSTPSKTSFFAQPSPTVAADGSYSFSGTGDSLTDVVELSGVYKVETTCHQAGYYYVTESPIDPPGTESFLFNGNTPYHGSKSQNFDQGRYAFSVACDDQWTLTFTPLS